MHSSALIDGLFSVGRLQQPNDIGSVAAHIAIGFTGQRHRHSGVVRLTGHRQRMACPSASVVFKMDLTICINVSGLDMECPAKMESRAPGS